MTDRIYACIDLKSFYASVECVERKLDTLTTNLVVADVSRTQKTICLAVSPSLKEYGIPGRARLFEVIKKIKDVNFNRRKKINYKKFKNKSYDKNIIEKDDYCEVDYIAAKPQMAKYIEYSTKIYNIYLKYISANDIHVYSIDEVFMDITNYLLMNNKSSFEFVRMIIHDILKETGITATAGIGTNMYLSKIAMDIVAKHKEADEFGARIAFLNEELYKKQLWNHTPLTDFWRIGRGYENRLLNLGLKTMGDIARCSLGSNQDYYNQDLLFKTFGINAELLIDHAWGIEPTTIDMIKSYKPRSNSISSGQVLHEGYNYEKTKIILKEMSDLLALDLVSKHKVSKQLVLNVGYDIENLANESNNYKGEIETDFYGRKVPKSRHGSINLDNYTSSSKIFMKKIIELFDNITNKGLLVRRINIAATNIMDENLIVFKKHAKINLFSDYDAKIEEENKENVMLKKEKEVQKTIIHLKNKFGKNVIIKGLDLEDGATTKDRNEQIGGHKA